MSEKSKYPRFSPYFNEDMLEKLEELTQALGTGNKSSTLQFLITEKLQTLAAARMTEKLQTFARQFSDKGELTEEETGYARAMLEVAGVLGLKLDETTDALLDHIEVKQTLTPCPAVSGQKEEKNGHTRF